MELYSTFCPVAYLSKLPFGQLENSTTCHPNRDIGQGISKPICEPVLVSVSVEPHNVITNECDAIPDAAGLIRYWVRKADRLQLQHVVQRSIHTKGPVFLGPRHCATKPTNDVRNPFECSTGRLAVPFPSKCLVCAYLAFTCKVSPATWLIDSDISSHHI